MDNGLEENKEEADVNIYCVRFDNPAFPGFDNQSHIAYVVAISTADAISKAVDHFELDSDFNGRNVNVNQINISEDNDQVAFLLD